MILKCHQFYAPIMSTDGRYTILMEWVGPDTEFLKKAFVYLGREQNILPGRMWAINPSRVMVFWHPRPVGIGWERR